jgi:hypothetical protein
MITHQQAIVRLIGSWCSKVLDDPDYGLRVTLADVLTHEAIEAVRRDNLLADHDPERPPHLEVYPSTSIPSLPLDRGEHRRAALIRAWRALRPSWGRVQ